MCPDERRIRIGNQTSFSAAAITAPFEYAVGHGFDAFEWFPDKRPTGEGWTEDDLDANARARIRRIAVDHDIALSVHASWIASPLAPAGRERLAAQADLAADLGASIFVVHLEGAQEPARFLEALGPLLARLAEGGIRLAVENTVTTGPASFNELFRVARREGLDRLSPGSRPGIGMCLDVGHANLHDESRNDYLAYVDRLSADVVISHVHLHENWGDQDSHLALFTGPAGGDAAGLQGLVERLDRRGFSGCAILEQWPEPPWLLDRARERLAALVAGSRATRGTPPGPGRRSRSS